VSARAGVMVAAGLALVLDLAGITWGLPARWHPDEKADTAAEMALAPRLRPDSFINPSLPLYLMAPALWVIAVVSTITVIHRIVYTWQETKAGRTLPGIHRVV